MSRNQRIMLVVAAVAVAVIAFVIVSPGGDDEEPASTESAATVTETETEATETEPAPATETETEPPEPPEPQVSVTRIQLQGGQVVGGPKQIEVAKGEPVRIAITSDAGDELHLHGYDITKTVEPGGRTVFNLKADLEGVFELESHVAEDAGRNPLVANLVVNPS